MEGDRFLARRAEFELNGVVCAQVPFSFEMDSRPRVFFAVGDKERAVDVFGDFNALES